MRASDNREGSATGKLGLYRISERWQEGGRDRETQRSLAYGLVGALEFLLTCPHMLP